MPVVSVDLAYLDYRDFGMAVLERGTSGALYELLPFANNSAQAPTPQRVVETIIDVCKNVGAILVVLDGPQGWKSPSNGSAQCRLCERYVNAPAKTGLPGSARPVNYLRFIEFAIQVFDAFQKRGMGKIRSGGLAFRPTLRDRIFAAASLAILGTTVFTCKKASNVQQYPRMRRG